VPDRQLSLAIGKEGQNARLAARLTGWRIDIKPASTAAVETFGDLGGEVLENDESLLRAAEALLLGRDPIMPVAEEPKPEEEPPVAEEPKPEEEPPAAIDGE
jgi:hypothetical protein